MNSPKQIAEIIREKAKSDGFMISDMLAACDLSTNTLSNMGRGNKPSYDSLAKMAEYAGLSLDYLVGMSISQNREFISSINGNNSGNVGNINSTFGGTAAIVSPVSAEAAADIGRLLGQLPLRDRTRAMCEIYDVLDKYKPDDSE